MKKRIKWEPTALMISVLVVGLWAALGPGSRPKFELRPGAQTQDIRIGDHRGTLEAARNSPTAEPTFRLLMRDEPPSPELSRAQAESLVGKRVVSDTLAERGNQLFRWLNITSWVGVVWLAIGGLGQLAFSGRMVLQWITSERRRQSVITESFWWFSLLGSTLLFSYYIWRQEPIGILGQASGLVVYARNLRLIYKQKRRDGRDRVAPE